MTFTKRIKDEISKTDNTNVEIIAELSAFIRYSARIKKNEIEIVIENASIARRIYKNIKTIYNVLPTIIVRVQKRFRVKQLYILVIKDKVDIILDDLNISINKVNLVDDYIIGSREEQIAFIKGSFLACGSISDPSKSGYHLEFTIKNYSEARFLSKLLIELNFKNKVLKRENSYMIYIKEAEVISDLLRLLGAINGLFYYEDIRIYRDHKNMVNRLNNCDIANQEKVMTTGLRQINNINYIEENNLIELFDEKTQIVIAYRKKYPESSYQELADIITLETDYKIGKSGVNHHFIKIRKLVDKHKETK